MAITVKEEKVVGFDDGENESEAFRKKKKPQKNSGGFQTMGLSFPIIKGIQKRGYKVPTPIQRKTIPLVLEGRDVVGMARTGSGKTACFLIPMLERLKHHDAKSGIRALVLSPSRELALQTYRFTKEIGKFTGLRCAIVLGGDSMEQQFGTLHNKPDVAIATPGRFLHICVEMELSLSDVQYVVFDEADRLFEMGFGEQLREIVSRLPESRQTVLFSATLPKVLVEFARAGLSSPSLVRLDVDSKLPDGLSLKFLSCTLDEKPAALLCLLKNVVKGKTKSILFAPTKHHVEYLHAIACNEGLASACVYSDLDPSARKINVAKFHKGKVNLLIVTDVAARGIDIPYLDNVINFNFPEKPKLFVHRVGRCARAGRIGTAYSLVSSDEVPYLLDLHLFLGRPLEVIPPGSSGAEVDQKTSQFGKIPRHLLEPEQTQIIHWHESKTDLDGMLGVSENAFKQYLKSRPGASSESVKRAKEIKSGTLGDHPLFLTIGVEAADKSAIIAGISTYRPPGTIFEIGVSSSSEMYTAMKKKRQKHRGIIQTYQQKRVERLEERKETRHVSTLEESNAEEIESSFKEVLSGKKRKPPQGADPLPKRSKVDEENYIHYQPKDQYTEQGFAVNNFQNDASAVGLDLAGDTENSLKSSRAKKVWDRKKKKMVGVNVEGKANKIKSESGAWISATFKSGRYKNWLDKTKRMSQEDEDVEEEEEEERRARPPTSGEPTTRYAKHNLKVSQRKMKTELKRPEQIVKKRMEKEKKRRRNGRRNQKKKKN